MNEVLIKLYQICSELKKFVPFYYANAYRTWRIILSSLDTHVRYKLIIYYDASTTGII